MRLVTALLISVAALERVFGAAEDASPIVVTAKTTEVIPIALNGYSPEVARVLEFDLSIVGFDIVATGRSQYTLNGGNATPVQGSLVEAAGGRVRFARAYPGGKVRTQAHALADDVARELLNLPGIARTRVAYRRARGARNQRNEWVSEIVVSDYDGADAVQVTEDNSVAEAPAWVPHKLGLFYTSYRSRFPDIYSHDLATAARAPFARFNGLNTSPAVSPDGGRVAMVLSRSGRPNVWIANLDGSNFRQLTSSREMEASPCWSPDGSKLCFTSTADGRPALYTIPAGGGTMKLLNTGGVRNCTEPDWSPDGKWIAFTRTVPGRFVLYRVPAGGGLAEELVEGEDPTWAPNSRTIMFTRGLDPAKRLSLLDVPTRRVKDVPGASGGCSQPSWSR